MRYQNKSAITRDLLIKNLLAGICQISFTKVKDNTERTIYCTLNKSFIPTKYEKSVNRLLGEEVLDVDILPIWDVVEGKWKSFRISKSVYFITSDEMLEENKTAQNTQSKWAELTELRKKEIMENFKKRIEELKAQAKKAKTNINGADNESEA
jgi:hypothetical protein